MNLTERAMQLKHDDIVVLLSSKCALEEENAALKRRVAWFEKQLFGQKSERRMVEVPATQLSLGEALGAVPENPPVTTKHIAAHERKTNHKKPLDGATADTGLRFGDAVPVKEIRIEPAEMNTLPADAYKIIDEKVTYRLAQEPSSYVVLKYVRPVIKLNAEATEEKTEATAKAKTQRIADDVAKIFCAPAPRSVIEKSYADVSVLAAMLIDKFVYHLPLYRQHHRLAASAIVLSRATLTSWTQRSVRLLLPIVEAQWRSVKASSVLTMDETPGKVARDHKGKMDTGYFWPVYGDQNEIVFHYHRSRGGEVVRELLAGFQGTLLTDGYVVYETFAAATQGVQHAQCWAHTRRGFIDAEDAEPLLVAQALTYLRKLYEHEEHIRSKKWIGESKRQYRVEHSKPVVEQFFDWLERELKHQGLLPSNPFTGAACYALQRKNELKVFLEDPDVPVDTNHIERGLKPIPMGRKGWLFCWTEVGAQYVAAIQSLLVTCKLHDVDPYTYLVDVLQRVDQHPNDKVHELTPRLWKEKFAANPLRSDLYYRA